LRDHFASTNFHRLQQSTLIVSLNPAIDVEWRVDHAYWEEKNQVLEERRWAGGKGINVARWLKCGGGQPRLLLPLGGGSGKELATFVRRERLAATIVPLAQPTRANVVITTPSGRQMRFNPLGPILAGAEWSEIVKTITRILDSGRCRHLVLSGALVRGAPVDAYAQFIRRAQRAGLPAILDCDGAALVAGVEARPFLIKPNEYELGQWVGQSLSGEKRVRHAALAMSAASKGWVLVSRGAKGAILVNKAQGFCRSRPAPKVRVLNTIGAGDALLAGAVRAMELGGSPEEWLKRAVACGTEATQFRPGVTSDA